MLPGSAHTRSSPTCASRGTAPSATTPVASAAVSASPPLLHVVMRLGPSVSRAFLWRARPLSQPGAPASCPPLRQRPFAQARFSLPELVLLTPEPQRYRAFHPAGSY